MDLHELTKKYGAETVAEACGMTVRTLVDVRRGKSPMLVDDFYELERHYPTFDLVGTVRRLCAIRESRRWNRKTKTSRK